MPDPLTHLSPAHPPGPAFAGSRGYAVCGKEGPRYKALGSAAALLVPYLRGTVCTDDMEPQGNQSQLPGRHRGACREEVGVSGYTLSLTIMRAPGAPAYRNLGVYINSVP